MRGLRPTAIYAAFLEIVRQGHSNAKDYIAYFSRMSAVPVIRSFNSDALAAKLGVRLVGIRYCACGKANARIDRDAASVRYVGAAIVNRQGGSGCCLASRERSHRSRATARVVSVIDYTGCRLANNVNAGGWIGDILGHLLWSWPPAIGSRYGHGGGTAEWIHREYY
jgi:hypothetical protein